MLFFWHEVFMIQKPTCLTFIRETGKEKGIKVLELTIKQVI